MAGNRKNKELFLYLVCSLSVCTDNQYMLIYWELFLSFPTVLVPNQSCELLTSEKICMCSYNNYCSLKIYRLSISKV